MADCIFNLRWHTWLFKCVTDQNHPKVVKITGKMRNELKQMKNKFSNIWFFRYGRFYTEIQKIYSCYRGTSPPTSIGLRTWTPHAFGLRTIASLDGVWIKFANISSRFSKFFNKLIFRSKVAKFSGKMRIALKMIFWFQSCFFVRLLAYEIWSDFINGRFCILKYIKIDHILKTRSRTKKNSRTKKLLSAMRTIPVNFTPLSFGRWHTWSGGPSVGNAPDVSS